MFENKVQKKNPLNLFFSLGDKVTGGDPVRKAEFDYYMMWILFLAFLIMGIRNITFFFLTYDLSYLTWALIGFAISYFQYFGLVAFYQRKNSVKGVYNNEESPEKNDKEVSAKEILAEFDDE